MTPKRIIAAVALAAGTTPDRMCDVKNDQFGRCRYIAVHLIHQRITGLKLGEIAQACGYARKDTVRRAESYVDALQFTGDDGLVLLNLACDILDKRVEPLAVKPIRIWKEARVYFPRSEPRVLAREHRMPGSGPGWLMTQKAVAALYARRNYRGPVGREKRAVA